MKLFGARSHTFANSDGIFLQAKWSKIKERVEEWESGKKLWFKSITVCPSAIDSFGPASLTATTGSAWLPREQYQNAHQRAYTKVRDTRRSSNQPAYV